MANALAIDSVAHLLLERGLAILKADGVHIDNKLVEAGNEASTKTLAAIASVLLRIQPPPWFKTAVRNGVVSPELIPTQDENSLDWLGYFRDAIFLDIANRNSEKDDFRSWLGSLGEHVMLGSEKHMGRNVIHASKISDSFGYDIESQLGATTRYIEVKTCLATNAEYFYISKNEAKRAQELVESWWLVQVIFNPVSATVQNVEKDHFQSARCLSAKQFKELLPQDTKTGMWIEAARISPEIENWSEWKVQIPPSWIYPGYRSDAK